MPKTYDAATIGNALRVVAANNGSLKAASRELKGIARSTLRRWAAGEYPPGLTEKDVQIAAGEAGAERAAEYRRTAKLYLDRLQDPKVVQETKARDAAVIVGILDDKSVRAEGGPTSINEERQIRYVSPTALYELAGEVIDAEFSGRAYEGSPYAITIPAATETRPEGPVPDAAA